VVVVVVVVCQLVSLYGYMPTYQIQHENIPNPTCHSKFLWSRI